MFLDYSEIQKISKFLSLTLRHKPEAIGLVLDKEGWADINLLIDLVQKSEYKLNLNTLKYIVLNNDKKRFSFDETGCKIRASQGHSIDVALGYLTVEPPKILYHGTSELNIISILNMGIKKQKRQHVHLSETLEGAIQIGKRKGNPYVFCVLSEQMYKMGFKFYLSDNNVWLIEDIPSVYVVGFQGFTGGVT